MIPLTGAVVSVRPGSLSSTQLTVASIGTWPALGPAAIRPGEDEDHGDGGRQRRRGAHDPRPGERRPGRGRPGLPGPGERQGDRERRGDGHGRGRRHEIGGGHHRSGLHDERGRDDVGRCRRPAQVGVASRSRSPRASPLVVAVHPIQVSGLRRRHVRSPGRVRRREQMIPAPDGATPVTSACAVPVLARVSVTLKTWPRAHRRRRWSDGRPPSRRPRPGPWSPATWSPRPRAGPGARRRAARTRRERERPRTRHRAVEDVALGGPGRDRRRPRRGRMAGRARRYRSRW